MVLLVRKILIVDSSSVLAMRIKVLLELIGCEVELIHFSMLKECTAFNSYDLVAVAHGVPVTIASLLVAEVSSEHILLLAPKVENSEQLSAFSELNRLVPNAIAQIKKLALYWRAC